MTLYESIFTRRAVRTFDKTPPSPEVIQDIRNFINETEQLAGESARFEIVTGAEVKDTTAPLYILAYCSDNDSAYANVGFVLEKADLYIQSLGLGSLWLGMAKPNEATKDYCIMLAFGSTPLPKRENISEFKRLAVEDISSDNNTIAATARLAPSAANSQPWKLEFEEGKVMAKYFGRGMLKLLLKKKLNKIDLGIITRYVVIVLEKNGNQVLSINPKTVGKDFYIEINYK